MPNYLVNISGSSVTLEMGPEIYKTLQPAQAIVHEPYKYTYAYRYLDKPILRELFIADAPAPKPPDPPDPPSKVVTLTASMKTPLSRIYSGVTDPSVTGGGTASNMRYAPDQNAELANFVPGQLVPSQAILWKTVDIKAPTDKVLPAGHSFDIPGVGRHYPFYYFATDLTPAWVPANGSNKATPVTKNIKGVDTKVTWYADDDHYGTTYAAPAYVPGLVLILFGTNQGIEFLEIDAITDTEITYKTTRTLPTVTEACMVKWVPNMETTGSAVDDKNYLGFSSTCSYSQNYMTSCIDPIPYWECGAGGGTRQSRPLFRLGDVMTAITASGYHDNDIPWCFGLWWRFVNVGVNYPEMPTSLETTFEYADTISWLTKNTPDGFSPTPKGITVYDVQPLNLMMFAQGVHQWMSIGFGGVASAFSLDSKTRTYSLSGNKPMCWLEKVFLTEPKIIDILNDNAPKGYVSTLDFGQVSFKSKADLLTFIGNDINKLGTESLYKDALAAFDGADPATEVILKMPPDYLDNYNPRPA